jgi:hypothetical protein
MTKLVTLFAALMLLSSCLFGQGAAVNFSPSDPSGTCTVGLWIRQDTGAMWVCNAGAWGKSGVPIASGLVTPLNTAPQGTGAVVLATSPTITTPVISGHSTIEGVTPTGATGTNLLVFATAPTLTNPVIIGPAPVACGATCSPTAGQLSLLNQAGGSTVTLPTSSGSGNIIRMRISVITTSAQEKVLLTTVTDAIIGTAIGENAGTAKVFVGNAGTYHSIQMPFAGSQPSGGFVGDTITCTDIAAGTWACDVNYQAGTTPTTPYSTATT